MNCLRCGGQTETLPGGDAWLCGDCGLEWDHRKGGLEWFEERKLPDNYVGGRWIRTPDGALAVFSREEEA